MAYSREPKSKRDWSFIIPILISIAVLAMDIIKLRVGWDYSQGNSPPCISYIRIISEAFFNAYMPIVIFSLYLHFSSNRAGKRRSKLSQRFIPLTLITSILCGVVFIVDACLAKEIVSWIFMVFMVLYVVLFHLCMYGDNVQS